MNEQTAAPATDAGPRLHGVIDVLRPDRIAGWVMDRKDAAANAIVEIRRAGRVIGTVPADRARKDLEARGVGTGRYGFSLAFDPPLEKGMEFTISAVAMSHDGVMQPLHPATRGAPGVSVEQKVLAQILVEIASLHLEFATLRDEARARETATQQVAERLETVQLRLEATLTQVDVPQAASSRWLWVIAVLGAVLGLGSLAAGLASLW